MRFLALAGLLALVVLIAWLTVQIVKVAPSAFSSLASLAEGIDQFEESIDEPTDTDPLITKESKEEVVSGETVTITWDAVENLGTYSFSYECFDGVTLTAVNTDGERAMSCDTNYNLGEVTSLNLTVTAEESVEIPYTLSFIRAGDSEHYRNGTAFITVVTDTDKLAGDVAGASTTPETTNDTEPEETPTPEPTPQPTTPTVQYTYQVPTSDPNGFINLEASYVNVGGFVNGQFRAGLLEEDSSGAVQFAVKNIGTKTSEEWSFTITLPDGTTFESEDQDPLKPNERSIFTLGFDTEDAGSHTFRVIVDTDDDIQESNDRFNQRVTIRN